MKEVLNMALKILSVLGTSDYKSGVHILNETEIIETEYIQNAIVKIYEKQIEMGNAKFCLFLTESAKQKHFGTLYNMLNKDYPNLEIIPIDIKDGKTKQEIWEIFEEFFNSIEEDDEIVVDITHSFRHLPMQLLVVVNYAKVLKNIKVKGIYYGAFEARYEENQKNIIPIHDITDFDSLLEWSYGANTFINYGNVNPILESYKQLQTKMGSNWNKEHSGFTKFIQALSNFSNCIYTSRGTSAVALTDENGKFIKNATKKSTQVALMELNNAYQNIEELDNIELKQIKPIINKVKKSIERFDQESTFMIGMESIKWSIEKNLLPQAYTIFSETIKTYVCNLYNLDETDYNHREKIVSSSLNIMGRKISRNNWRVDLQYMDIVETIISTIDERITELYDKVGTRRNDINHYGLTKDKQSYENLSKDIKELFEDFRNVINTDKN